MKNIILDTDIGPDCDDAAAAAILNIYANRGLCRILSIGHCTSNPYGAGAVDAICRYYGRADVPIGTYKGKSFLGSPAYMRYNKYLTKNFPNRYREAQPGSAVKLYRKILSSQEDGSVCLVAIGPLNNISALLDSGADEYSPLNGKELAEKKLGEAVFMAGAFPCSSKTLRRRAELLHCRKLRSIREFNVASNVAAAKNVAGNLKAERFFLGFEAGLVKTCASLKKTLDDANPVKAAYRLYTRGGGRYSWDLFTVQFAVIGESKNYRTSERGRVRFDSGGRTLWTPDKNGTDRFIELAEPFEEIARDINALLADGEPKR